MHACRVRVCSSAVLTLQSSKSHESMMASVSTSLHDAYHVAAPHLSSAAALLGTPVHAVWAALPGMADPALNVFILNVQYFLLREHERCIELLARYDSVGVDWNEARLSDGVRRHYSGNFWWARADYYLRLDAKIGTNTD